MESLAQLMALMKHYGAERFYAKKLSPNDNSKNQVYLGGDFSVLNIFPHSEVFTDAEESVGSKRDRAKAKLMFFWVDSQGKHLAPDCQLILYPKYPEVRLSGFLKSCYGAPSKIMASRDPGRILVFGISQSGEILGHAVDSQSPLALEINARIWESFGVFVQFPADLGQSQTSRSILLNELRRIHRLNWIASQKLNNDGLKSPYLGGNGGGFTLEAEFGIPPNSRSQPDFLGWEIKQYGVNSFKTNRAKSPVTLMTPSPSAGEFKSIGAASFIRKFGYPDKSGKPDRINFGGVYTCLKDFHGVTGLKLILDGYDTATDKITDMDGSLVLVSRQGVQAAVWSFKDIMSHWNRKHAQAVYVPSMFRTPPAEYFYGTNVQLCSRTDFTLLLKALASGVVYYDPGLKIAAASSLAPALKSRSQFRIALKNIKQMYHQSEVVDLSL